jgi:hypothetical protein
MPQQPRLDLRPGVSEPVVLLISRREVEEGDLASVLSRLKQFLAIREDAWRYRGQMTLVVAQGLEAAPSVVRAQRDGEDVSRCVGQSAARNACCRLASQCWTTAWKCTSTHSSRTSGPQRSVTCSRRGLPQLVSTPRLFVLRHWPRQMGHALSQACSASRPATYIIATSS